MSLWSFRQALRIVNKGVQLAAGTNAPEWLIGVAPFDGAVARVTWCYPSGGSSTSDVEISIVNKGRDGTGTAVVATLDMPGELAPLIPLDFSIADPANVAEGDLLVGEGDFNVDGLVSVSILPR